MAYNFGEVILDSIDKGKRTAMSASELKMRKEQAIKDDQHRAKVLAEAVESRKKTNEIQKAVNKMKEDQLIANLTGMYQGKPTWARQTYEEGKTVDMSLLTPFMTEAQQDNLKNAGIDLKNVDSRYIGLLGPIIGSQLQSRKEAKEREGAMLPPPTWKNPEGTDKDWGPGIDQGEIVGAAEAYLSGAKKNISHWKQVKQGTPDSPGYQAYVKELKSLQSDLDNTKYFPHDSKSGFYRIGRKNFPANVKAREMSKEISELLLFLGE